MLSRRSFLSGLSGVFAGTAVTGAATLLHLNLGDHTGILPLLKPGMSRVTLNFWRLDGVLAPLNAKHYFLCFECEPLGLKMEVHGLATNRKDGSFEPMGMPSTTDIRVHTFRSALDKKESLPWCADNVCPGGMAPHQFAVLYETDSIAELFKKYLIALKAGKLINKKHIPYRPVALETKTTNSNAVAQTLCDFCGFKIPEDVSGLAPGLRENLLPGRSLYPLKPMTMDQLTYEVWRTRAELKPNAKKDFSKNPESFEQDELANAMRDVGYLQSIDCPVNTGTLKYLNDCQNFEKLKQRGRIPIKDIQSAVRRIVTGQKEILLRYGVNLDMPPQIENILRSGFMSVQTALHPA